MPYTPTVWVSTVTAVDAAPMNNLETQYEQAMADILTVAETEVFASAAPPLAWTDLDISAVVGTNAVLVLLKVGVTVNPNQYAFRINGDGEPTLTLRYAANTVDLPVNEFAYVICATDANGILEWIANANRLTTIDVVAYVKRE